MSRSDRRLALVERSAAAARASDMAMADLVLDEVTSRVKAHQARRRRRLRLQGSLRAARDHRGRALAVFYLALYWFCTLGLLSLSWWAIILLGTSATLLSVAILVASRMSPEALGQVEPPAPQQPPAGPPSEGPRFWGFLRCLWRERHEPVRHPLGGFRCAVCGVAGADLSEMGFKGGAYVPTLRRVFGREPGQGITRSEW